MAGCTNGHFDGSVLCMLMRTHPQKKSSLTLWVSWHLFNYSEYRMPSVRGIESVESGKTNVEIHVVYFINRKKLNTRKSEAWLHAAPGIFWPSFKWAQTTAAPLVSFHLWRSPPQNAVGDASPFGAQSHCTPVDLDLTWTVEDLGGLVYSRSSVIPAQVLKVWDHGCGGEGWWNMIR